MAVPIYIPTNSVGGFPSLRTLSSIYCLWIFLMIAILAGVRLYPIIVLICISLIIRDFKHLFMCLSTISVYLLWRNIYFPPTGRMPEKTIIRKDTWVPMFAAAMFTITRTWKQPNVYQQRNGQRRCGTYVQWNIINHKKERERVICRDVDGPRDYYVE